MYATYIHKFWYRALTPAVTDQGVCSLLSFRVKFGVYETNTCLFIKLYGYCMLESFQKKEGSCKQVCGNNVSYLSTGVEKTGFLLFWRKIVWFY